LLTILMCSPPPPPALDDEIKPEEGEYPTGVPGTYVPLISFVR
jgi:hypothetical protein